MPVAFGIGGESEELGAMTGEEDPEVQTRGSQITTSNHQDFAVNARYYSTGSQYGRDFFDAQKITWSEGSWTYNPVKYWPTTGVIDFYAYSPTQDQMHGTFESLNMPHNEAYVWLMHYNVKSPVITSITELSGNTITQAALDKAIDADNQQDLMLACNVNNVCSDERGINSKVSFTFRHALAGLNFKIASPAPAGLIPTDATHVIISIAPMCIGGTMAMTAAGDITWTTDESEATFYQAYEISGSQLVGAAEKTFFLPPQKLKNFTVTVRFYRKDSGSPATYTLLGTRTSNRNNIELKQGVTQTITLSN